MNFKKIFQSFDFQDNRIRNAKLDSQITDNEHIVNKLYVDESFIYSTQLSQQYNDSITISRMLNNDGKTFSKLFDELLFGIINPEYYEVENRVFNVICKNQTPENNEKFYVGLSNILYIYIETKYNDRSYLQPPTLTVNGYSCQLVETSTNNNVWCFKTQPLYNVTSVVFSHKYAPYSGAAKLDNRGNTYVDPDYQTTKTISTNFTDDVNLKITKTYPVLISERRANEGTPDFTDAANFMKYKFDFTDANNEEIRDILIPERDFSRLSCVFITASGKPFQSDVCNYDSLMQYTNADTMVFDDVTYIKAQFNFGYCIPNNSGVNAIGLYV